MHLLQAAGYGRRCPLIGIGDQQPFLQHPEKEILVQRDKTCTLWGFQAVGYNRELSMLAVSWLCLLGMRWYLRK